jgi:thiol-disulfide isomerase/thioredoxin
LEYNLLRQSVLLGYADATARFEQLEDAKLGDKNLGEAGRVEIVMARERRRLSSGQFTNRLEYAAALERAGHELTAGFPDHPEGFALLLNAAASSEPAKGRALIQEVLASANTNTNVAALKESAEGLLRRMGLIGQPLKLEFTALDGREVDTTNLKGKVVLVDFWATWCGPCVALVPELKGLYDKYHERGLEIVGMDMDVNKESVENFVQDRGIPWPQFFDTSGPINHYAQEFAVEAIPQVWLIDKKGVLRDMEGRMDLESKLEGLLAE